MKTKFSRINNPNCRETGLRPVSTRFILMVFLALSPAPCALCQVPQGFNYQAIARDGSGNPISDPINVKIAILSDDVPETVIWEELHSGVDPDEHGLFSIVVGQGTLQEGFASFNLIDWTATPLYIRTKINDISLGIAQLWSVPYAMVADSLGGPVNKLKVLGAATSTSDEALFEVKNKNNQTVFAVYNAGVRIHVDNLTKDPKGGFSVGGYEGVKADPVDYLTVTRDFTQVNVNRLAGKGVKGGFSVGGFDAVGKVDPSSFMVMTPENYFIGEGSGQNILNGLYNSTLGYNAGRDLTDASSNVFIGYNSGLTTTIGANNLFIGHNSGSANINGENNIFLGVSSGLSNTGGIQTWMGSNNIFLGMSAGITNTLGGSNIFIGSGAGRSNLDGNLNIYIGDRSGFNSTGVRNTFIGAYTGEDNIAGTDNIFIGNQSGESSTGSGNTYLGSLAGWHSGTGNDNTYIGKYSGQVNADGNENAFLGAFAGGNSQSGSYNVFLGSSAGGQNSGNSNTFMGYYSGYSNNGNGSVFLGYMAGANETQGDRLYIDNSSRDKDNALIYGEFGGSVLKLNAKVSIRDLLKIKPGTAPETPEEGDVYYDAADHVLKVWNGTDWKNCWEL